MTDTDAIVTFGVQVTGEEVLPFPWPSPTYGGGDAYACHDPGDLGEYLARCQGIECPYDEDDPEFVPSMRGWLNGREPAGWAKRVSIWEREVRRVLEEAPIEVVRHCCKDCVTSIVALKGTTLTAKRKQPVDLALPKIDLELVEAATAFCADNRIHPFEEPKWLLCSYWG